MLLSFCFRSPQFPSSKLPKKAPTNPNSGWMSEDSAFGSADPTPTHSNRPNYSGLEFNEDPFKDADHRYGDPFELEGGDDPFNSEQDPFTASVDDAFGTLPKQNKPKPATANNAWDDPWAASSSDPLNSNTLDDSFDPFSAKSLKKTVAKPSNASATDPFSWGKSDQKTSDPFGANSAKTTEDPFGASAAKSADPFGSSSAKSTDPFGSPKTSDPFGSNAAWAADPFSAVQVQVSKSKTSADPFGHTPMKNKLQKSETTSKMPSLTTQSLSRPWGKEDSIPRSRPKSNQDPFMPGLDLHPGDKKEKKNSNFKLGHFKPSNFIKREKSSSKTSSSSTKVIKNDLGGPSAPAQAQHMAESHVRMASEASKKAEEDRMARLRRQEEQDLAYAIALSKAEAASLSNQ